MKLILEHFPNLNNKQIEQFSMLKAIYKNWNQKINVISRKDIDNINLFTFKITMCFMVEDSGIEPLTS